MWGLALLGSLAAIPRDALGCDALAPDRIEAETWKILRAEGIDPALLHLERVWNELPSHCGVVAPSALGQLALFGGGFALGAERADTADRWFGFAAMLTAPDTPHHACRSNLGAAACERYGAQVARVDGLGAAEVLASQELWIDGVALLEGARRSVPVGVHLLQVEGQAGTWVSVESGMCTVLPSGEPCRPPSSGQDRLTIGVPLALGGAALGGAGAAVWVFAYRDTFVYDCVRAGPGEQDARIDSSYAGFAACQEIRDVPMLTQFWVAVGLVAAGTTVAGAGLGVIGLEILPRNALQMAVTPGGVALGGRF